jgi:eukaryotic-like serine/threonine-protein kinase
VESLFETPGIGNWEFPTSWSPDGRWIAFTRDRAGEGSDVEMMATTADRTVTPFAATAADEVGAAFSHPDGRWVAYVSDESGRSEVYVQPFPGPGRRLQISTAGGVEPVWSRDGRELFYRRGNALLSVALDATSDELDPGTPEQLLEGRYQFAPFGGRQANYDVSLDGRRFLMVRRKNLPRPTAIEIVLNWPEALLGGRLEELGR